MVDFSQPRTIYNQSPNRSLAVAKQLFKSTMDYTTVNQAKCLGQKKDMGYLRIRYTNK